MIFKTKSHNLDLYNTLLQLSRNLYFYSKINLKDVFEKYIKVYKKECEVDNNQWPDSFGLEPFRIKRYTPDGQNFPPHVDVNTKNNCSRFLAFFLYLTNNKEGSTI